MSEYANFDDKPPYYGEESKSYYDKGQGIPQLTANNMTQQDVFRTPFLFTQEHKKNYGAMSKTAEKAISSKSELSKMFFSDRNVKRIQTKIKDSVYERTNKEFRLNVNQDENDLLIAMTAAFKENARHLPQQLVRQVKKLNQKVVNDIVPDMITMIRQEHHYIKEINEPIKPIMRPMNVNNAGSNTLPSITSIWGM